MIEIFENQKIPCFSFNICVPDEWHSRPICYRLLETAVSDQSKLNRFSSPGMSVAVRADHAFQASSFLIAWKILLVDSIQISFFLSSLRSEYNRCKVLSHLLSNYPRLPQRSSLSAQQRIMWKGFFFCLSFF